MSDFPQEPTNSLSTPSIEIPIKNQKKNGDNPAPIDPGLIAIAQLIKDGFLQNQEKEVEALKLELKSRFHISILIIAAILVIILSIVYLTIIGKFDISTFAFLLGTSVGSLLTIMGKMFSSNGQ
jgi:hypothetical protein